MLICSNKLDNPKTKKLSIKNKMRLEMEILDGQHNTVVDPKVLDILSSYLSKTFQAR